VAVAVLALACAVLAQGADATAPPVGSLPTGPTTSVGIARGGLVSVALAPATTKDGRVWRVARAYDSRVVRQVSEGELGTTLVVVFRAVGRGSTKIVFAQTRGETSPKALRAATYAVHVR
jgi:hypothetical protein